MAERRRDNMYGQAGKFEDYQIENAGETIMRAEKTKKDKAIMPYVENYLKKMKDGAERAISSLDDLRKKREEMEEEGKD